MHNILDRTTVEKRLGTFTTLIPDLLPLPQRAPSSAMFQAMKIATIHAAPFEE